MNTWLKSSVSGYYCFAVIPQAVGFWLGRKLSVIDDQIDSLVEDREQKENKLDASIRERREEIRNEQSELAGVINTTIQSSKFVIFGTNDSNRRNPSDSLRADVAEEGCGRLHRPACFG